VGEWKPGVPARELLTRDRLPEAIHDLIRRRGEVGLVELEVLGPQAHACLADDVGVAADDVHLGVIEERVPVEVRGADREPRVVDDAHLRVDIDGVAERAVARVDRAREQPPGAVVGFDQLGQHSARVVGAGVRLRREQQHEPEVVRRRPTQLLAEDLRDLRRPEELVL
jgi:hypothetical protein